MVFDEGEVPEGITIQLVGNKKDDDLPKLLYCFDQLSMSGTQFRLGRKELTTESRRAERGRWPQPRSMNRGIRGRSGTISTGRATKHFVPSCLCARSL